eukprot:1044734-Lingulodinium_polyedra.AAC.1
MGGEGGIWARNLVAILVTVGTALSLPSARQLGVGSLFQLIRNHHYARNKYGLTCLPTAESFACQVRRELMGYFRSARG